MVQLNALATVVACILSVADAATLPVKRQAGFPNLPFTSEGPNVLDASGNTVKFAGTNWPGHGEVMVPEGLQYQSIETIVADIKGLGMNVVRLTYAIEMIDQIYANNGEDVDLQTAFTQGLGQENGTTVLANVLSNNPQFTASTKRLEVYDAVVAELNRNEIYINLDNHMSKGAWCCSATDGNTWWGDTYYDADNWVRGLAYMANHGKSWSNLASMSLRNELREPTNNAEVLETYNWETWYTYIKQGADAVHAANPDVLVVLSGLNYDTTLQPVVRGTALTPGNSTFNRADFAGYENKLVLELHNYNRGATSCANLSGGIYNGGAQAMNPDEASTVNVFPVWLTEFGFPQDGEAYKTVYPTCLAEWLPDNTAGWMNWVVVGSYYIRSGVQDFDELWGLYNHDWSSWRDAAYVDEQLKPMVAATL
ncbi:Glycosyl hydrolase 5 family protein [Paramyrothecium foliicola]|nr:Glycosyl hydrolase 5 family protein [Paramyrothecium foliicola]